MNRKEIIAQAIKDGVKEADKKVGKNTVNTATWNRVYHAAVDRICKKAGVRV